MSDLLPRVVLGGVGLVGVVPGLYCMLWFGWLSSGPNWAHQRVGIVIGFTISTLWTVAVLLMVFGAIYSYFHDPKSS